MKRLIILLVYVISPSAFCQSDHLYFGTFFKDYELNDSLGNAVKKFYSGGILPVVSHKQYDDHHGYTFYLEGVKHEVSQEYFSFPENVESAFDSLSPAERLFVDEVAKNRSTHDTRIKKIKKEFAIAEYNKAKINGFLLIFKRTDYEYLPSDKSLNLMNLSKKTVKYMWFTFAAYNRVNDYLGTKVIKQLGPIEYRTSMEMEDYSLGMDNIAEVKMKSLKIQYTDGSIKIISNPMKSCFIDYEDFILATDGKIPL